MTKRKQKKTKNSNKRGSGNNRSVAVVRAVPITNVVSNRPRGRNKNKGPMTGVTAHGEDFLKAAFAPPDVGVTPFRGIPDDNNSNVVALRDEAIWTINPTAGKDTYVIVAPIPGMGYAYDGSVDSGSDPVAFSTFFYPGASTKFPINDESRNFSEFRCGGMAAELKNMANDMQWGGSIACYKIPMSLTQRVDSYGTTPEHSLSSYSLNGLRGVNTIVPKDSYYGAVRDGVYAVAYDRTGKFEFSPIVESLGTLRDGHKVRNEAWPDTTININSPSDVNLPGFGNTDVIVFKISCPEGSVNSLLLKTWHYYEFKPSPYGAYMDMSGLSPPHDPVAMQLYNRIKTQLPTAVRASQNENFWSRVLSIARGILGAASYVPGPIGIVAGGIRSALSVF